MLGIVFSEFTEMVEEVFSAEMVEKILDDCDLESGGATGRRTREPETKSLLDDVSAAATALVNQPRPPGRCSGF